MINPREIYQLLLDYGNSKTQIQEIIIGLTWTFCQSESLGLCMSPAIPTRTLSWSGDLVNKTISELSLWINNWQPYEATVAMAAINSIINHDNILIEKAQSLGHHNLAVFDYFFPKIKNQNIVVVGRYPGLSNYETKLDIKVIELQPNGLDFPAPAAEFLLPEADWVFLTATSIVNKTFPRLVELSKNAKLVLMGPTVPWLAEMGEIGINYLAGVAITNPLALKQAIAQGGGTKIFTSGVEYRLLEL